MPKQKTKANQQVTNQQTSAAIKYELIGIAIVALAVYSVSSLYATKVGTVGGFLQRVLSSFFGQGALIFCLALAWQGVVYMLRRKPSQVTLRTAVLIILYLVLEAGLQLNFIGFKLTWDSELVGQAGGFVGLGIIFLFYKAFGPLGTYILLTAITISCLLILTDVSVAKVIETFGQQAQQLLQRLKEELVYYAEVSSEPKAMQPEVQEEFKSSLPGLDLEAITWKDEEDELEQSEVEPEQSHRPVIDHTEMFKEQVIEPGQAPQPTKAEPSQDQGQHLTPIKEKDSVSIQLPPVSLLNKPLKLKNTRLNKNITDNVRLLEETLKNFGVSAKVTQVTQGPAITRYEVQPAPGVKVSRIVNLADDLALNMAATDVRIEAPIPGKAAVGIEVPNPEIATVALRDIIDNPSFQKAASKLTVALGKDLSGEPVLADLTRMPHLLIAGSTGSGKSVCMNGLIASVLFKATPEEVKLLMIDPKMVELTNYNGIPHLIAPVVTDAKKAATALQWAVREMEQRYNQFADAGVKNIAGYNKLRLDEGQPPLPLVLVLIDELADLMMVAPNDVEDAICRLAQMARAAGIHLVIATQRPSVDVITGLIKANVPSRIAFAVSSQVDSRTILDMAGAEKLLGKGDMLYYPIGSAKPMRVQGAYVSETEIDSVVNFLKNMAAPEYEAGVFAETQTTGTEEIEVEDEYLPEAAKMTIEAGQASISMLQRRLRIGYTRAARLMDAMEAKGIVGGYEGSKPRTVKMTLDQWRVAFANREQSASSTADVHYGGNDE